MTGNKKAITKRDLERSRKQILDAAAREFSEYGMTGGRMDRIAQSAGVSKAMIYYAFGGKEDLHLAVLENLFEEKTETIDSFVSLEKSSPAELLQMINIYFDAFLERREYVRIMVNDVITGASGLRRLKKKRPDLFQIFDDTSKMLGGSGEAGLISEIDSDKSVMLVIMVLSSLVTLLPHMDLVRSKKTEAYKDLTDPESWKIYFVDMLVRIIADRR